MYANVDVYGSDGLTIRVGVPIRAKLTLVESWSVEASFNWKIAVPSGAFQACSLTHLNKLAELLSDVSGLFESWKWPAEFELSPLTRLIRSTNGDQWLTVTVGSRLERQEQHPMLPLLLKARPEGSFASLGGKAGDRRQREEARDDLH